MLKRGDLPYWNQTELLLALNSSPDVVIIMLGTNDAKPQNFDSSVPGVCIPWLLGMVDNYII